MPDKNLRISEETHHKLSIYCSLNRLKIKDFITKIILEKIADSETERRQSERDRRKNPVK